MENFSYEQAVKRLEEIIRQLESGELSLEESINLYKESAELSDFCSKKLNEAELLIKEFSEDKGEKNAE